MKRIINRCVDCQIQKLHSTLINEFKRMLLWTFDQENNQNNGIGHAQGKKIADSLHVELR